MKYFGITGVAGYIAPRHLQAIHDTGNQLLAAMDPHDSAGILDRYFMDVAFFTEFERFDRHLERLRRTTGLPGIDYLSVCSPNYLHDAHIRLALRLGAHAICEKPLVINPWNLDALQALEAESAGRIYNVLQLRVHPTLMALKAQLDAAPPTGHKREVVLSYITSRGPWYRYSWKGDPSKSGGIATNIGIHFFDLLLWFFGPVQDCALYLDTPDKMSGYIELGGAHVRWYLSIDRADLPAEALAQGQPTYRSITIDGAEVEFSGGFADLHTRLYEETLAGRGFDTEQVRPAIELVHRIRTTPIAAAPAYPHPFLRAKRS